MQTQFNQSVIRAVIGLGNPGKKYERTRHNIGFRVVDALCQQYGGSWRTVNNMEHATIRIGQSSEIHLIKPTTFMNSSGQVLPFLQKKGIKPEHIVVVHDELEKKFGDISLKFSGSAKGHNGLRSIIATIGADFWRIRCGIGRPADRDEVGDFVLTPFTIQEENEIPGMFDRAIELISAE